MDKLKVRHVIKNLVVPTILDFGLTTIEFFGMAAMISNIDSGINKQINGFMENHKIMSAGLEGATAITLASANVLVVDKLSTPVNDVLDDIWASLDMRKIARLYDNGWTNIQIAGAMDLPEKVVQIAVEELEKDRIARKGKDAKLRPKEPEKTEEPETDE